MTNTIIGISIEQLGSVESTPEQLARFVNLLVTHYEDQGYTLTARPVTAAREGWTIESPDELPDVDEDTFVALVAEAIKEG